MRNLSNKKHPSESLPHISPWEKDQNDTHAPARPTSLANKQNRIILKRNTMPLRHNNEIAGTKLGVMPF